MTGWRCVMMGVALTALVPRAYGAQAVAARDSAGVAVRHYTRTAAVPARWRLDPSPMLTIGGSGDDPKAEFSGIRGVVRLADAHVIVADAGARELRDFDARGRFVKAWGRRGTGPGEFDGMSRVTRLGDTVLVTDLQDRLSAWGPGGVLRQSLGRTPVASLAMPVWLGRLRGNSDVFVGAPPMFQPWNGVETLQVPLVVRSTSGTTRTVATIPGFEVAEVDGRQMPVYLGPAARIAIDAEAICVAWSKVWELTCYDGRGTPRWRTTRDVPRLPLSDTDKEAFRNDFRRGNRGMPPDRIEGIVRAFPFAKERPTISRIELARSGELWVGEFVLSEELQLGQAGLAAPDRPTTWSVLARDGAWLADVTLPARFRLLEAGSDYVAGVLRDEDDVERVVLYRLLRGS